jgi:putative DNA primase/helicase
MTRTPYTERDLERIAKTLGGAERTSHGFKCRCPVHNDHAPSLDLDLGEGGVLLAICRAGCEQADVWQAMKEHDLLLNGEARPRGNGHAAEPKKKGDPRIVATYPYTDEGGRTLFEVVRYEPKAFKQRRPDGKGGHVWSLGDTRRVLYHLPEVLAASEVVIVEGEKDADRLRREGFVATTSPQGAKAWRDELALPLTGKLVIIIPDNDPAGRKHAERIAASAREHGAASVKIIDLGLAKKGDDVSNWLDAGHTAGELQDLIAKTAEWVDLGPVGVEDDGHALELGREWGDTARHVALWGRWLFWNGSKWVADERLLHMTRARAFLRRKAIGDARVVARVIGLARSNEQQAATVNIWDADPWLLNTPGGIVDLRTGLLRPSDPLAYCTKSTAVAPAPPGTPTPIWDKFLKEIFWYDPELIPFVHRVLGYGLTGLTIEHVMIFAWGQGANGKGTLFNTAFGIMGDYAAVAPTDMLLVTHNERHPTDMAKLRGARMVLAQEVAQGRAWDEVKLKSLTGGDPITARFMRQDSFTYQPQFLLIVAGNHKPSLKSVDIAISRRLNLLPFLHNIPEGERDLNLPEKLKAEWPGILRKMIDGCVEWHRDGLQQPLSVRQASEAYLEAEDTLGQWLAERCDVSHTITAIAATDALYVDWRGWSEMNGQQPGSRKAFSTLLSEHGFVYHRDKDTRGFKGLRLKQKPPPGG